MRMYELEPLYDSRASFYGKAQVFVNDTIIDSKELKLYSYGTLVASTERTKFKIIFRYNGYYSQTTTRHQKEFFFQEGLRKKDWELLKKKGSITYTKNGDVLE